MTLRQQENGFWYDCDGMATNVFGTLDSSKNYSKNFLFEECKKEAQKTYNADDEDWDIKDLTETTYAALIRKIGYTPSLVV